MGKETVNEDILKHLHEIDVDYAQEYDVAVQSPSSFLKP